MARKRTWTKADGSQGKSWEAVWRGPDGRQVTKGGFDRKRDADAYEDEQKVDILRGQYTDPRRGQMTYGAWARQWWEGYQNTLADSTRIEYERLVESILIPVFGDRPLAAIAQEEVQSWVNTQDVAPATVAKRYDLFQRSMKAAELARRIPSSPCVGITLPRSDRRRARVLTPAEVERLVDVVDPRYRAMLLVAAYGGLRLGELAGLQVEALDLLHGQVHVVRVMEWQRGKPVPRDVPKSNAGRRAVGLPGKVVKALEEHLDEHGPSDEGYVFASPLGSRLHKDNFRRRVWKPALEAAGLNGLRFHDLRHTAASLMIRAGGDPLTVSRRLGHAKTHYTMDLYGHLFPDDDADLRENLDEMIETSALPDRRNALRLTG